MPLDREDALHSSMVDELFEGIIGIIETRFKPFKDRLSALEARPSPEKGDKGDTPSIEEIVAKVPTIKGEKGDTPAIDYTLLLEQVLSEEEKASEVIHRSLRRLIEAWLASNMVSLKGEKGDTPEVDEAAIVKRVLEAVMRTVPERIATEFEARAAQLKGEKGDSIKGEKGDTPQVDEAGIISRVQEAVLRAIPEQIASEFATRAAQLKGEKGDTPEVNIEELIDRVHQGALDYWREELPKLKGEKGDALTVSELAPFIEAQISSQIKALELPRGEKGEPGDTPTIDVDAIASRAAQKLGAEVAALVTAAVSEIPKPKDADAVDYLKLSDWITDRIRKEFTDRHTVLKGDKGDSPTVEEIVAKVPTLKGEKGEPGKDAADPELIEQIVERKLHKLISSLEFSSEQKGRDVAFRVKLSGNIVHENAVHFDVMQFRGVWKEGEESQRGDVKSWDGSSWHCNVDGTLAKPGTNSDWTLMTKRGQPGRDLRDDDNRPAGPTKPISLK